MKTLLKTLLLTCTATATLITASAKAQTFGECVSTDLVEFNGTVVDAAIATPALSTLVDAVVTADLAGALAETQNITVYAPTNDAFAALPSGILEAALADTGLLTTILTYHVTPSKQDPRKWISPRRAATLAGPSVFFHRQGREARVNNAAVTCEGVKTSNGTVWVIDTVLLP